MGLDLEGHDNNRNLEELKAEFEPVPRGMKQALGDKAEKVVVSLRMPGSSCVLTTSGWGWSANVECLIKAPALSGTS